MSNKKKTSFINKFQKGFTLIELLVVIAIISLLSTIVMTSLNSARNNGKDAAAKESMLSLRSISELYYLDNDQSYTDFCTSANAVEAMGHATTTLGAVGDCDEAGDGQSWAAEVLLKDGNYFCIDTRGGGKIRTVSKGNTGIVCPAI